MAKLFIFCNKTVYIVYTVSPGLTVKQRVPNEVLGINMFAHSHHTYNYDDDVMTFLEPFKVLSSFRALEVPPLYRSSVCHKSSSQMTVWQL